MIKNEAIARRYAKGFLLSLPKEKYNKLEEEFSFIVNSFKNLLDFKNFLLNPAFLLADKNAVLQKIIKRAHFSHELSLFLEFLLKKNRITLLPNIFLEFRRLVDEENNRLRVQLHTFSPLSDDEINNIKAMLVKLKKQEIIIESAIDKELLGGIRLEMAGTVFDASIKNKLELMKHKLLQQVEI